MALDRILLAIGPDDHGHVDALIDGAVDIVEPADATVYLLYYFSEEAYEDAMEGLSVDPTTGAVSPDELAERTTAARASRDRLESPRIDYEIRGVVGGDVAEQVVRRVEDLQADVVVIGGRRRSPTRKAVFGDDAQQILLNAPVPVLYIKRE